MKLLGLVSVFAFFSIVCGGCGGGGGSVPVPPASAAVVGSQGPTPPTVPPVTGGGAVLPTPVGKVLMSVGASAYSIGRYSSRADLWEPALAADFKSLNLVSGDVVEFTIFPRFQQIAGVDGGPTVARNLRIKVILPAQLELAGSRRDALKGFYWGYDIPVGYFSGTELAQGISFGDANIYFDRFPSLEFRARATSAPVGSTKIELRSDNFPPQDVKITF